MSGTASKIIKVVITGDAKDLSNALVEAGGKTDSFVGKLKGLSGSLAVGAFVTASVGTLYKLGEGFDRVYDHIRAQTGATGDALKGLEDDFRNVARKVPESFDDVGIAIGTLNTKLGLTGKPLEDLSEQFLNLAHITHTDVKTSVETATSAFNAWGVSADQQGSSLDEMFRVSQKTGVGVDALSEQLASNETVLKASGMTFESSAALLGLLGSAGLDASNVMPALTKAMATAAKEGKPANEVISDTFAAIKKAPDATVAAGLAMGVFGAKAGPKLAEMIRAGKLGYEGLLQSIQGGGPTINKTAKDTADFSEKLGILKNRALLELEPVMLDVFNAFASFADFISGTIIPDVKDLTGWLGDHKEVMIALGIGVASILVPAIVAWGVAAATTALAMVPVAAAAVAAAAPVIALGAGISALAFGLIYAYQHLGFFRAAVDDVGDGIKKVWDKISAFAGWMSNDFVGKLQVAGRVGLAAITGGASEVVIAVAKHWDTIIDAITGLPGRINSAASGLFDGIKNAFKSAINWIIDGWNSLKFSLPEINTHIPGIGKIGGETFGVPSIPLLALGGLVTSPTLGLIGEAGPELVLPLSRPDRANQLMQRAGIGQGPQQVIYQTITALDPRSALRDAMNEAVWVGKTAGR